MLIASLLSPLADCLIKTLALMAEEISSGSGSGAVPAAAIFSFQFSPDTADPNSSSECNDTGESQTQVASELRAVATLELPLIWTVIWLELGQTLSEHRLTDNMLIILLYII